MRRSDIWVMSSQSCNLGAPSFLMVRILVATFSMEDMSAEVVATNPRSMVWHDVAQQASGARPEHVAEDREENVEAVMVSEFTKADGTIEVSPPALARPFLAVASSLYLSSGSASMQSG
jgi:hypothetical protein